MHFIKLLLPDHSSSIKEVRVGSREEHESMNQGSDHAVALLAFLLSWILDQLPFLQNADSPVNVQFTECCARLYQPPVRKLPHRCAHKFSDGGKFSTEAPTFQVRPVCLKSIITPTQNIRQ